jgi:hypothetical protein
VWPPPPHVASKMSEPGFGSSNSSTSLSSTGR